MIPKYGIKIIGKANKCVIINPGIKPRLWQTPVAPSAKYMRQNNPEGTNTKRYSFIVIFQCAASNYKPTRRMPSWSYLTEVSLMGNGTWAQAERQELSRQ